MSVIGTGKNIADKSGREPGPPGEELNIFLPPPPPPAPPLQPFRAGKHAHSSDGGRARLAYVGGADAELWWWWRSPTSEV